MGYILVEGDEPTARILQFPPECSQLPPVSDAEIGRMRGVEDRRLCKAAVERFYGDGRRVRPNALQGDLSVGRMDRMPRLTDAANVASTPLSLRRRANSTAGDIPTRPGNGSFNWLLWGRMLKLRQFEIEFAPLVVINREWARVIERRVAAELYPPKGSAV